MLKCEQTLEVLLKRSVAYFTESQVRQHLVSGIRTALVKAACSISYQMWWSCDVKMMDSCSRRCIN